MDPRAQQHTVVAFGHQIIAKGSQCSGGKVFFFFFNIVVLVLQSKACEQRHTKGYVEAFDVSFFCVQVSWLLMRQPASLLELCKALTQLHGGTASTHCSEATNYSSLAPHWD